MRLIESKISSAMPAVDLLVAITVARAVAPSDGRLTRAQLAIALGHNAGAGNANGKILAAQRFGLIYRVPEGTYLISDLGRRCIVEDPSDEDVMQAISNIKAFAAVLQTLGPSIRPYDEHVVDEALARADVPHEAVADARRLLFRSLSLLKNDPAAHPRSGGASKDAASHHIPDQTPPPPSRPRTPAAVQVRVQDRSAAFIDIPAIKGLLDSAPPMGSPWPEGQQDSFVEALRHLIRFIYR